MSTLHIQPETGDRAPEPAKSTDEQFGQMPAADRQSNNKKPQQDLAHQKASNKSLQQSPNKYQVRKENQPPVEDCAARLKDLQAHLEQKHTRELKEQAARIFNGIRVDSTAYEAEKNAELGNAITNAEEENRRSQQDIAHLEKRLGVCQAKLEEKETACRNATWTIQSLQYREKELGEDKKRLFRSKKELEASLSQRTEGCRNWSVQARVLKKSLKRTDLTLDAVRGELMETAEAKERAEAETRSLRAANRALRAEKEELEAKSSAAIVELNASFVELDRFQMQSKYLTADLVRVGRRLAEYEATIKKDAETIKKDAEELRQLEVLVDRRLDGWDKWEEVERVEREIGVPEKANKGLLRPHLPRWMKFVFWLLVGLLLVLLVVAFEAASAADRERQMWLGGDEVTLHAVVSLRVGEGPELLWHDPLLALSRGMYGV